MFRKGENFHMDDYRNQSNIRTEYGNQENIRKDLIHTKPSKQSKHKRSIEEGFGTYCNKRMRESLITGFPTVATSRSTVRRTVKLLVFFTCTAGFSYQTFYFLQLLFLAYPTIQSIEVIQPAIVNAPAVTVCNKNRLKRRAVCAAFPDRCILGAATSEEFCDLYPKYCSDAPFEGEDFRVLNYSKLHNLNRSNEVLNSLGPQREYELIALCLIMTIQNMDPMCKNKIAIQASRNGYPIRCFAVESLWGKPEKSPRNVSVNDEYVMVLRLAPEEYLNYYDLIQAYVYVHDPRTVANPTAEGVLLRSGFRYKLYVSMEKRESLPSPYITNCTDYKSMWVKNGGYGPMTQKECTEICKIKSMLEEHGCVGQSVTYPNNYTICNDRAIITTEETNAKCSESCNEACESITYSIKTEVEDDLAQNICQLEKRKNMEYCRNEPLWIHIVFSRMRITKYKHEPKFQGVELFSYIGGYMGMWLGISLVSLFDFVEMMFDILAYPVIKWNKNKNKMRQIENMSKRRPKFDMYDM